MNKTQWILSVSLGILLALCLVLGIYAIVRASLPTAEDIEAAPTPELISTPEPNAVTAQPSPTPGVDPSVTPAMQTTPAAIPTMAAEGAEFWYAEDTTGLTNYGDIYYLDTSTPCLDIRLLMGSVRIEPTQDEIITIQYDAFLNNSAAEAHSLEKKEAGEGFTFDQTFQKNEDIEYGNRIEMIISIPESFDGTLKLHVDNGQVLGEVLDVPTCQITVNRGFLLLDTLNSEMVTLSVSEGDITVYRGAGAMWNLQTATGNISAIRIDAFALNAQAVTGNIEIGLDAPSPSIFASAATGDVLIRLPVEAEFAFFLDSTSGEASIDDAFSPSHIGSSKWSMEGAVGDVRNEVRLSTFDGAVRVERLL